MHQARQEQLIVHPGAGEGMKCLAAVTYAARRLADCRLLDLKLLLESDMPKIKQKLLNTLKGGSSQPQLGRIAAFRLALVRNGEFEKAAIEKGQAAGGYA